MSRDALSRRSCLRVAHLLLVFCVPCIAGSAFGQEAEEQSPLDRPRAQYADALEKIQVTAVEEREATYTKYSNTLVHLAKTYQQRGHLDALLAVKQEQERFGEFPEIPEETAKSTPVLLQKTQVQARAALAAVDRNRANAVVKLTADYITHLERLKRKLTTEDKLEEAVAVRDEIEKVQRGPAYTAANFEKVALDAEQTEEDPPDRETPEIDLGPTIDLGPRRPGRDTWNWSWNSGDLDLRRRGLTVDGKATLGPNGMKFHGGRIVAEGAADQIQQRFSESNELTLEAVFITDSLRQGGPARILGSSLDGDVRNFSLCQEKRFLVLRLRTTRTGRNGSGPKVILAPISKNETHHVLISYRPNELVCVLDGKLLRINQISGDFSSWESYQLVFGNEAEEERPWFGTIKRVSIRSTFTSPEDAVRRFAASKRQR